jgi:hypothetical protein
MTWFSWKGYNSGQAVDIAGTQEKQAVTLGFHGYGTQAQAQANPNSVASLPNPLAIPQKEFVNAIIADYGFAKKAGEQPGGPNANILNPENDLKGDASYAANRVPGLTQIGQFFSNLTQANTWIRVGKVIVGGLLLIIGLVHITGSGGAVADTARKVPLPI